MPLGAEPVGKTDKGCCPQRQNSFASSVNLRLKFWTKGTFIRIGIPSVRQCLCSNAVVSSESLRPASAVAVTRQSHRSRSGQESHACQSALLGRRRLGTGSSNGSRLPCFITFGFDLVPRVKGWDLWGETSGPQQTVKQLVILLRGQGHCERSSRPLRGRILLSPGDVAGNVYCSPAAPLLGSILFSLCLTTSTPWAVKFQSPSEEQPAF